MGRITFRAIKDFVWVFAFLSVLIIFTLIFAFNGIYPFGNKTVSWCDMNQQTIPLLCEFKDILSGEQNFFLSMQNAGGMNFYGVYFFNISSPISLLVLFFEKSEMAHAVNLMVVIKLALCALTFSLWLKRAAVNANPFAVIFLSIVYAFSGWAMMYYQILSWLDIAYIFPVLLIGLSNMAEGRSGLVYILSLIACVFAHFYLSWAVIIFVCLYALFFMLFNPQRRAAFCKQFIIGSLISALISFIVLIPCFLQYLSSMRGESVIQTLLDSAIFPNGQTSYPTFFCLFAFIPFVIIYFIIGYKKGNTDHWAAIAVALVLPCFIEPIAKAWQTYNYMSFPTRYGFITVAIGLTLALKGIGELSEQYDKAPSGQKDLSSKDAKNRNAVRYICSASFILFTVAFAFFSYRYLTKNIETLSTYSQKLWGDNGSFTQLILYYLIPLALAVALVLAFKHKIMHKIAVYGVIGALCVIEAFFSCGVYMVAPSNEYESFKRASQIEGVIEDGDFYRLKMNAKYFDVNFVGAMGYNSLTHYTSLNSKVFMSLMKELGYSSYWMETGSNGGTVFTDALMRHKYTLKSYSSSGDNVVAQTENYKIVQNDFLFPTAYYISEGETNALDQGLERWQIQDALFTRLTGKSGLHKSYGYTLQNVNDLSDGQGYHFEIDKDGEEAKIIYSAVVTDKCSLYFDCFDQYTNNLTEPHNECIEQIKVKTGYKISIVSSKYPTKGNNGSVLLGEFENTVVTVEVYLQRGVKVNSFGVFSVDHKTLEDGVNGLIGGDFTLEKGLLKGNIVAPNDGYLITAFPYDEGYQFTVNGKSAQAVNVCGLLAVRISGGESVIKAKFIPKGLWLGVAVAATGVLMLALYVAFRQKIQAFVRADKLFAVATAAIGAVVVIMIYLMPLAVCVIGYL